MRRTAWSQAALDRGAALWADGKSAKEVARMLADEQLGDFTRNAICGQADRRAWGRREQPQNGPAVMRVRRVRARKEATAKPKALTGGGAVLRVPAPEPAADGGALRPETLTPLAGADGRPIAPSVAALKPCQCRWPIGDPMEAGFAFCARPAPKNPDRDPYCDGHRALTRQRGTSFDAKKVRVA